MRPEDVEAGLVEKAAREIYAEWENEYSGDYPWPAWGSDENLSRDTARTWARNILAVVTLEIQAQALRDAANDWQGGEWASAPRRTTQVKERLANGQFVGDWLRKRAARLATTTEEPTT